MEIILSIGTYVSVMFRVWNSNKLYIIIIKRVILSEQFTKKKKNRVL